MINTLKQALEALENYEIAKAETVTNLRTLIEQLEKVEPVAYLSARKNDVALAEGIGDSLPNWTDYYTTPLYAHPTLNAPNGFVSGGVKELGDFRPLNYAVPEESEWLTGCPRCGDSSNKCDCYDEEFVVPEGWKLVPIEPTERMLNAANMTTHVLNNYRSAAAYSAMINAAPEYKEMK